jgi:predicted enzyme related to lactoylglutathione lyase
MDVFKTHGAFSWSELTTPDPAAAVAFYGPLFGWKAQAMPMPNGSYTVLKAGDAGVGGIMLPPAGMEGAPPAWGVYVTVTDVDATVSKAVALGGKVCAPAMDIPGVGRMAVLADPQGAVFNVMQYSGM